MKKASQNKISLSARVSTIFIILCIGSLFLLGSMPGTGQSSGEISIFLAGDAIFNRAWSHFTEPEFLQLIDEIRGADVALCNLETLIHTYKGFPQTNSGGTYMASEPYIADELAWAGFDMLGVANNHTFNYGSIGVLETIQFVEGAGMKIAGGGDLQRARRPVYYYDENGTVALISATSTFADFQKASNSRPDLHGRAGCNPLTFTTTTVSTITRATAEHLQKMAKEEGISESDIRIAQSRRGGEQLRFLGQTFQIGDENGTVRITTINESDLEGNLEAVRRAEQVADLVVFSMLYSLGNFAFQSETVTKLPAEYVEGRGYDHTTTAEEFQANTRDSWNRNRAYWEGLVATVHFKDGVLEKIRLIPTNLGVGPPGTDGVALPFGVRGRPVIADNELGKYLIDMAAELSKEYGTEIGYITSENIGVVNIK
ncbi:hypothetical protein AMJ80_07045 [bacterium SM23_31]|nr:MAG: hypothetical protein AMJ80_07045 [bacterium SM23_31]